VISGPTESASEVEFPRRDVNRQIRLLTETSIARILSTTSPVPTAKVPEMCFTLSSFSAGTGSMTTEILGAGVMNLSMNSRPIAPLLPSTLPPVPRNAQHASPVV
jgi:hypothetical protein